VRVQRGELSDETGGFVLLSLARGDAREEQVRKSGRTGIQLDDTPKILLGLIKLAQAVMADACLVNDERIIWMQ